MSKKPILWSTERRKVKDLIPWARNPRKLSEEQAENLKKSLNKFGIVEPPAINRDNTIIGGHQRTKVLALLKEYGEDAEIDVRVPNRTLTEREVEELNVRLNKNTGEFNLELLIADFQLDDLLDWGFKEYELGVPSEEIDYSGVWEGMPEYEEKGGSAPAYTLLVHFESWEDMQAFSALIEQPLTKKSKSVWYPFREKLDFISYGVVDES